MEKKIPFNKPYSTGDEIKYINKAIANGHLSGGGPFTLKCQKWLEKKANCHKALLTHSCTAALEMAAILAGIQPGDEIIMPSYTFVSTANAFVLRGGVPVFVDIREDTLNIDESKIEGAITDKTKAIVPVHYAGVACEMDAIMSIAEQHGLLVIEDAAQGIMASYKGRPLGSIGHLSAISFHETKNIVSGEGGALLVNDLRFIERAEIVREKGTNRSRFLRGQIDKYTWVDIGSSYLPSEIIAAFLWAQLEQAEEITGIRLNVWAEYHESFKELEILGVSRPVIPFECQHNGHIYYILLPFLKNNYSIMKRLQEKGIHVTSHYVPLHNSPAGRKYGRVQGNMKQTLSISERIIRLPLWVGVEEYTTNIVELVIDEVRHLCSH